MQWKSEMLLSCCLRFFIPNLYINFVCPLKLTNLRTQLCSEPSQCLQMPHQVVCLLTWRSRLLQLWLANSLSLFFPLI
jgi:hypothetical protein